MRTILRRTVLTVLAIVLAVVLGTLVPRPLFPATAQSGEPARTILVFTNPIHTDIVIPIDAGTLKRFGFLAAAGLPSAHPDARWLAFGWGSRAFYIETPTWADLKPGPLLAALTVDRSVMLVSIAGEIDPSHPAVAVYDIGAAEFAKLLDFIEASFQQGPGGPILIAGAAYGAEDGFFEANDSFNALLGCNTWTAAALREAGLQTGWWNPLPATLKLSLELHN